ncbi:MAG: PilN domain-containing protein [Halioglobus sp.]|nr:PilN domain-containing protein [Halioglobus sp.]
MANDSQAWNLFGFDVRHIGHYFRSGWRDFLWGEASPVLAAVDEVVRARLPEGGERYYRAGRPTAAAGASVASEAVVIPDQLVLAKELRLPLAAEAELESVLALEVRSSSPFDAADTCFGWTLLGRDETEARIQLVISSTSAVMAYIGEQFDVHEVTTFEVWADAGGHMVTLAGFGEDKRRQRNRRRMLQAGALAAYSLVALVAVFGCAAGLKKLELDKVRALHAEVEARAAAAVGTRAGLVAARDMINVANTLSAQYPSPHRELQRLAQVLDDSTFLSSVEISGGNLKITGESADSSAVMQVLLDNPAYALVEAPVASKKVSSGNERFVFDLALAAPGEEG